MRREGKVLLLGAGYTLTRVAEMLGRDRSVLTVTSSERAKRLRSEGWCAEDLRLPDEDRLRSIVGLHGVISVVDGVPPIPSSGGTASPVDTAALSSQIRTLGDLKLSRAVYLSTSGVFGIEDGSWVDEATQAHPKYPRAAARLAYEEGYRSLPFHTAIVRVPAIYGPGRGLSRSLLSGRFKLVDGGSRYSNRIHVEDLARLVVALLEADAPPPLVAAGDDEPALLADVAGYYASLLKTGPVESISLEEAKKLGMHTLTGNQRIRNKLMKEVLGAPLAYPTYREGALSEIAAS